jgi:hypothetical protein
MATDQIQKRADAAVMVANFKFQQGLKKDIRGSNLPPMTDDMGPQFCDALAAVLEQPTPAHIQVST